MKFNYHIIILLLLIVRLFTPSTAKASQNYINNLYPSDNDEFETLMEKIRKDFAQNPLIDEFLHKYDTAKGCFTDVDYSRRDRTNWEPLTHIDRLYDFAFAYTNPQNTYYQNEDIYNKIVKGLEYWYERNPNCNNWWYNQIAEPQKIGILLIQMRVGKKQIPAELKLKPCNVSAKKEETPSNGPVLTEPTSHFTGFTGHVWKKTRPTWKRLSQMLTVR